MTTAIDRAAKAIEAADEDELLPPFVMGIQQKLARAALATTREPTPEMIAAWAKEMSLCSSSRSYCAAQTWHAMHDVMMAEEKEPE
jgi:hypothetical protein